MPNRTLSEEGEMTMAASLKMPRAPAAPGMPVRRPAAVSWLVAAIRRYPVFSFISLVFAIGWLLFLPPLLARGGLGLLPIDLPSEPFKLLASTLGLTGAAFLVTAITEGRSGVRRLMHHVLHWRVGAGWYLIAVFGMCFVALLSSCLLARSRTAGRTPPAVDARLQGLSPWGGAALSAHQLVGGNRLDGVPPATPPAPTRATACQCYDGSPVYADPCAALLHRRRPLRCERAAVGTAALCRPAARPWSIPRVIATWLFNGTQGSLPIVGLFHAGMNATVGAAFLPVLLPGLAATRLAVTRSPWDAWAYGTAAACAVILLILTRGRLAYRPERGT